MVNHCTLNRHGNKIHVWKMIAIILVFLPLILSAQYKNSPGFAKISGGYGLSVPAFKNTTLDGPWTGIHFRYKWFETSYFTGAAEYERDELPDTTADGGIFSVGWNIPVSYLKFGNRELGVWGILIQPIIGIHYSMYTLGGSASAASLSPGLTFQFPYVIVDARMNMGYTFTTDKGHEAAKNVEGFMLTPEITFQLDGLFDLWNPKIVKTGRSSTTSRSGTYIITRTSDDFSSDVRPFWAITPRMLTGIGPCIGTGIGGIGFSGRAGALMADASIDFGSLTVLTKEFPEEYNINTSEEQFNGQVFASRFFIGAGFSPIYLFKAVFRPRSLSKVEGAKLTPMFRNYLGVRFGYSLVGDVKFDRSEAGDELDVIYQNHPDLEKVYDAREMEAGVLFSLFYTIELASISLSWEVAVSPSAALASQQTFGLTYLLPYKRLMKFYKQ